MAIHSLPTRPIVITMIKVILKTDSIEPIYDGGWKAFVERYEMDEIYKPEIVPLTAMSYGDLNATVEELMSNGLSPGSDFAVADARQGVLESCEGIEFEEGVLYNCPHLDDLQWFARPSFVSIAAT